MLVSPPEKRVALRRDAMSNLRSVLGGLAWAGAVTIFALLAIIVVVPMLMGWTPLTVLSGSMEPTIPTGSQVVVEHIDGEQSAQQLAVGDVVTFLPNPDDRMLVTHRIERLSTSADGARLFTTRGDNNNVADPETLTALQLRGVVKYHVPYAGYISNVLNPQQKSIGIFAVVLGLSIYAGWQIYRAIRPSDGMQPQESSPS